jgi:hypothetical protein
LIPISQSSDSDKNEFNLSSNCNFKLDLNQIELLKSPLTYIEMANLFNDWKFKVEKFKLLMQINHSKNGFIWSDRSFLPQNQEFLNKLDFMKYDKNANISKNIIKDANFIKIHQNINNSNNNIDNNKNNSNNKISSNTNIIENKCLINRKMKLNSKRSPRILSSKIKKFLDENINSSLTSLSSSSIIDCLNSNDDLISDEMTHIPTIVSSPSSSSSSTSSSFEQNHSMIYVKQNGFRFNENRYDSTINMIYNTSDLSVSPIVNSNINNNINNSNINNSINLAELTNIQQDMSISNCSYLNLLNSSFTNSAFFNQNDLNVPQCIVDSTVEELLNNDLRVGNEISIENDKFMYF